VSATAEQAAGPESTAHGSLSPSRAADFKSCPLLYRFRTIDRLPERPSPAATRGTLVHAVLERLFDLQAPQRTLAAARDLVDPLWQEMRAAEPEVDELFPDADGPALREWLDSARDLLDAYFALEDPTAIEPAGREQRVDVVVDGLRLRGYVDRVDADADGRIQIVDYKTGSSPRMAFEAKALFQMKFYALVLWRLRGAVPARLTLMYLADRETLSYSPDADELARFERTLHAIWSAVDRAVRTRDFRPSPSRLCDWCDHQALCPAFGGTPPPFPDVDLDAAIGAAPDRRADAD